MAANPTVCIIEVDSELMMLTPSQNSVKASVDIFPEKTRLGW
jgi:hypothetical protein